jgi:hypothetical protein
MKKFHILDSTMEGHRLVLTHWRYILRLVAVPLVLKIICFSLATNLADDRDFILQALIMLPSYLADGWVCAHMLRLVYFNQTWPHRPEGNADKDLAVLQDKARGIMAGTVSFALVKFIMAGYLAITYTLLSAIEQYERDAVPTSLFFAAFILPVFAFWAFRLLWIYIPASVNRDIKVFLNTIKGFWYSVPLLSMWLLCFFPLYFLFNIVASVFIDPDVIVSGTATMYQNLLLDILRVLMDTGVSILATACIGISLKPHLGFAAPKGTSH